MSKAKRGKHGLVARVPGSPRGRPGDEKELERVFNQLQAQLDAGDFGAALEMLEPLLPRLGKHADFRAWLAHVYSGLGLFHDAAVQARMAVELAPRQERFRLAAALAYFDAGYYTLAYRARQDWRNLNPTGTPLDSALEELDREYEAGQAALAQQYGLAEVDEAEQAGYYLDMGRWALADGRWADAVRYSREAAAAIPGWPPPRNNASTALYFLGRPADAVAEAEAVLAEAAPDNIHALANLVRYSLALGDTARAAAAGARLAALPLPGEPDSAVKLVEGLSLLDRDQEIDSLIGQLAERPGDLPGQLELYAGIAAANLGRRQEALDHVRRAWQMGVHGSLTTETLDALARGQPGRGITRRYSYTHYSDWAREEALKQLGRVLQRDAARDTHDQRRWDELFARFPQLPLVLQKMLYEGFPGVETSGRAMVLGLLAHINTPRTLEILLGFIQGQEGEQEDRLLALRLLHESGALAPDAQLQIWIDGQWHTVQATVQEVSNDFRPAYSPAALQAWQEAMEAHRAGRLDEAERAYQQMLQIEPKAKEAYNNLAAIAAARGETDRGNEYLDQALAIDPLYAFPRATRAVDALRAGDIDGAKEWLQPLSTVQRWEPSMMVSYRKAEAQIALAEGQVQAARRALEVAQKLAPDDEQVERLLLAVSDAELTARLRESMDLPYRRRRQAARLPADPNLDDCLALLTREDMRGIAQVLRIGPISKYKKDALRDFLRARLLDRELIAELVSGLRPAEQAALRDLLGHGGVMEWHDFAAAHGDDMSERPYFAYWATRYQTTMGRLRARALLFEGTVDSRLIIAIPRELREVVGEALQQNAGS